MTNFTTKLILQDQIETLEYNIAVLNNEITSKQNEVDNFEYECSESEFDEMLDDGGEERTSVGTFYPSDILKSCDPIAYRIYKSEYESEYDLDNCEEYTDLKDELESLENQLSDLESELSDLQDELDNLESNDE